MNLGITIGTVQSRPMLMGRLERIFTTKANPI